MIKNNNYQINGIWWKCTGGYDSPFCYVYTFIDDKGNKLSITEQTQKDIVEESTMYS